MIGLVALLEPGSAGPRVARLPANELARNATNSQQLGCNRLSALAGLLGSQTAPSLRWRNCARPRRSSDPRSWTPRHLPGRAVASFGRLACRVPRSEPIASSHATSTEATSRGCNQRHGPARRGEGGECFGGMTFAPDAQPAAVQRWTRGFGAAVRQRVGGARDAGSSWGACAWTPPVGPVKTTLNPTGHRTGSSLITARRGSRPLLAQTCRVASAGFVMQAAAARAKDATISQRAPAELCERVASGFSLAAGASRVLLLAGNDFTAASSTSGATLASGLETSCPAAEDSV